MNGLVHLDNLPINDLRLGGGVFVVIGQLIEVDGVFGRGVGRYLWEEWSWEELPIWEISWVWSKQAGEEGVHLLSHVEHDI